MARRVAVLDATEFRIACLRRGADSTAEMAELLGVHRTTVLRALRYGQKVGPHLLAAIYENFTPEEQGKVIKVEDSAAA